jgi:hypothetical protein
MRLPRALLDDRRGEPGGIRGARTAERASQGRDRATLPQGTSMGPMTGVTHLLGRAATGHEGLQLRSAGYVPGKFGRSGGSARPCRGVEP